MKKETLMGVCSICLILAAISEFPHRGYYHVIDLILAPVNILAAGVALFAVLKAKKWGFILAIIFFIVQLLVLISGELIYGVSGSGERFIPFVFPEQTATIILGLIASIGLIIKANQTTQITQ